MKKVAAVLLFVGLAVPAAFADPYCMTCYSGSCTPVGVNAFRQCMSMSGVCRTWDTCTTEGCTSNVYTGEETCDPGPYNQTSRSREPEALLASSELDGWSLVAVRVVTPRPAVQVASAP